MYEVLYLSVYSELRNDKIKLVNQCPSSSKYSYEFQLLNLNRDGAAE